MLDITHNHSVSILLLERCRKKCNFLCWTHRPFGKCALHLMKPFALLSIQGLPFRSWQTRPLCNLSRLSGIFSFDEVAFIQILDCPHLCPCPPDHKQQCTADATMLNKQKICLKQKTGVIAGENLCRSRCGIIFIWLRS